MSIFDKVKDKKKTSKYPQPYLITRFGAAFFDLLFVIVIAAVFQLGFYFTGFNMFNYQEKRTEIRELARESGLYVVDGNSFVEVSKVYTENNDLIEQYEERITYFYTHDERAIKDNKIVEFKESKLITKYFTEIDGELVKSEIDQSYFLNFYKTEYDKALKYFQSNPTYILNANDTFMIFVGFGLASITLSCAVVYLLIPLLTKKKVTPAQGILCLMPVDYVKDLPITNKQTIIKFFVILFFEYWLPVLLFI